MNSITTTNVGVFASALSHVSATFPLGGVVNADRRPSRVRGEVCPLTPTAQIQGTALSTAAQPFGTGVMGFARLNKYRTGSYAQGLTG